LVPSGDEPSGTVTNVATGTGLTGGPITDTGTIALDMTGASNGKVLKATSASTVEWGVIDSFPVISEFTSTIAVGSTSATVRFTGTFVSAIAMDASGNEVSVEKQINAANVVFEIREAISSAITCKVLATSISVTDGN